jgi:hypothetical protein
MWTKGVRKQTTVDPVVRFWSKVEKAETCWLWQASLQEKGYGQFWLDGRMVRAHKYAYFLAYGTWPPEIDHTCRTRACVNPSHLRSVTHLENMADRRIDVCKRGLHRLEDGNLYVNAHGRQCKACQLDGNERRRKERIALKKRG